MKLFFTISFQTKIGENLQISIKEEGKETRVYPLNYFDNGKWIGDIDFYSKTINYKYQLVNNKGEILDEELVGHQLYFPHNIKEFKIFDTWNLKNYPENYLNNKVLRNTLNSFQPQKQTLLKKHTHLFRIEAPLYRPDWQLVLIGNVDELGNWDYSRAIPMNATDFGIWEAAVTLETENFIQYKYGILDTNTQTVIDLEHGNNRYALPNSAKENLHVVADHYYGYAVHEMYREAGVAIPVFSLRSERGFGVGEFNDLEKLADWAKTTNLRMIQVLPINDTTADYTWGDSYPYSAISVYALHPQYLSIDNLDYALSIDLLKEYETKRKQLNKLESIDYEQMISGKWKYIKAVFQEHSNKILKDKDFKKFIKENKDWLEPYAAFCVQRDKYKTADFTQWKTHKKYVSGKVAAMFKEKHRDYSKVMLHFWTQYQLHLQLKKAVDYVHRLGISIKGDLPIGINRNSVEAWTEPELFDTDFQTGAPPDDFSKEGQNWGFPTYNWEAMKEDDYQWWKNRFKALEQYFDAIRIDHILGFFRIWRMPISATQGILGYFSPAVPVTIQELKSRNIPFNTQRYCRPYIDDRILYENFGGNKQEVQNTFLSSNEDGTYHFKKEFDTQRKIKNYFEGKEEKSFSEKLISLCANVLFLEEDRDGETVYHPRFNLHETTSYQNLPDWEKKAIYDLSINYFYERQEELWSKKGMERLPVILDATEMLVCGEDLGLIPDCVPQIMGRLAISALKLQRMPKENIPFTDPESVSYLNVVTTSSHDSSTLRQWWKEDRDLTQLYFNQQLNQWGTAPNELEPELAEIIIKQHLASNAMLAIFPLQEFLATDRNLRNENIEIERINVPANYPHNWSYRMHLRLEDLLNAKDFNNKITHWMVEYNRN